MPTLTDEIQKHYGRFLGVPSAKYSMSLSGYPTQSYHLLEYKDVPCQGAVTLATLGLSDMPLHMFRQEFAFLCYDQFISDDLIRLLTVVAGMISESNHPLLHGSVLPPAGPLLEYTPMESLYVGTLMYFNTSEENFDVLKANDLTVLISWLLPIYSSEANWISQHGYDDFESLIVERDPDLMDLERPPII